MLNMLNCVAPSGGCCLRWKSTDVTQSALHALGSSLLEGSTKSPGQLCCLQVTDVGRPENSTMLDYTKHHSLKGVELGKLRRSANRITAHTDESLITLLLHSPGELCWLRSAHPALLWTCAAPVSCKAVLLQRGLHFPMQAQHVDRRGFTGLLYW